MSFVPGQVYFKVPAQGKNFWTSFTIERFPLIIMLLSVFPQVCITIKGFVTLITSFLRVVFIHMFQNSMLSVTLEGTLITAYGLIKRIWRLFNNQTEEFEVMLKDCRMAQSWRTPKSNYHLSQPDILLFLCFSQGTFKYQSLTRTSSPSSFWDTPFSSWIPPAFSAKENEVAIFKWDLHIQILIEI